MAKRKNKRKGNRKKPNEQKKPFVTELERKGNLKTLDEQNKAFVAELEKQGRLNASLVLHEPEGFEKLSKVVLEFIEPYMNTKYVTSRKDFDLLLAIAAITWNVSMLPEEQAKDFIEKSIDEQSSSFKSDNKFMIDLIEEMMERKRKHFAQYTRSIVSYRITETKAGLHLSVVSTMGNEDIK